MNSGTIREHMAKIDRGGVMTKEPDIAKALWEIAAQLAEMNEREYARASGERVVR